MPEKCEGQFECLGKNAEKYITFSVPIKKEIENGKTITYEKRFIDSLKFIASSLSSLADILAEGPHNNKVKDCKSFFNKDFNKDLTKRFANTHKYCYGYLNKNCLMLRKGVYPYKYINF